LTYPDLATLATLLAKGLNYLRVVIGVIFARVQHDEA
jgi:hypothetical protein